MNKVTPFLWFEANAEAAAEFYLGLFPESRRVNELRYTEAGPGPAGSLLAMDLEIAGQPVTFLNGGPSQRLTDAFSFTVRCEDQEEIDRYWSALSKGGVEKQCGWLTDRFGVTWQVVPTQLSALLRRPGAMRAMLGMRKLVIAELQRGAGEAGKGE